MPAIRACGFGYVAGNALDYVIASGRYVTKRNGGDGCFREVVDLILRDKKEKEV